VRPKALAAVDEELSLGANGHKKYGGGENEAVGTEHFLQNKLEIILNATFSGGVTGVTLVAGGDAEITQAYIFG
jgi:hypothetical protein